MRFILPIFLMLPVPTNLLADSGVIDLEFVRARIVFSAEHEGGLHILDVSNKQVNEVQVGMLNIGFLDYDRKKNILVFEGTRLKNSPKSIYLYHFKNRVIKKIYNAGSFTNSLRRPRFHPGGESIYAVNANKGIYRYSLKDDQWSRVKVEGSKSEIYGAVSFAKSGKVVAISPRNFNGFIIADLVDGKFIVRKHILNKYISTNQPQWVGDHAIIFAGRNRPGPQRLWKLDFGKKNRNFFAKPRLLTQDPIGVRDYVALSRDEKTVVFTGMKNTLEWRLWKITVNGDNLEQLTKGGRLSGHLSPTWVD